MSTFEKFRRAIVNKDRRIANQEVKRELKDVRDAVFTILYDADQAEARNDLGIAKATRSWEERKRAIIDVVMEIAEGDPAFDNIATREDAIKKACKKIKTKAENTKGVDKVKKEFDTTDKRQEEFFKFLDNVNGILKSKSDINPLHTSTKDDLEDAKADYLGDRTEEKKGIYEILKKKFDLIDKIKKAKDEKELYKTQYNAEVLSLFPPPAPVPTKVEIENEASKAKSDLQNKEEDFKNEKEVRNIYLQNPVDNAAAIVTANTKCDTAKTAAEEARRKNEKFNLLQSYQAKIDKSDEKVKTVLEQFETLIDTEYESMKTKKKTLDEEKEKAEKETGMLRKKAKLLKKHKGKIPSAEQQAAGKAKEDMTFWERLKKGDKWESFLALSVIDDVSVAVKNTKSMIMGIVNTISPKKKSKKRPRRLRYKKK